MVSIEYELAARRDGAYSAGRGGLEPGASGLDERAAGVGRRMRGLERHLPTVGLNGTYGLEVRRARDIERKSGRVARGRAPSRAIPFRSLGRHLPSTHE